MASFVWGFNTFNGTSLPECAAAPIFLQTPGATQPPYYFFAHEAAGITTVHSLGSDINNLTWTVDHAAGSQLVLSMADAAGNSGGVAPNLYTVTSSGSTSCHAQNPTSPVSITTNVTKSLQSCEILPIKVSGGTKPYTVTVTALASGAVTNFTLSSQFDTYNWVNRASPNAQLLASVSDANGIYAPSTNLLTTFGSTDLTCGGLQSTEVDSTGASPAQSGSTFIPQPSTTSSGTKSSSTNGVPVGTAVGGIVGGIVLVGVLVTGALFFLKRKKHRVQNPREFSGHNSWGGFGLQKVGEAGPDTDHLSPHAEEVTPFVYQGVQAAYTDRPPYPNSTYSSTYSQSTLGLPIQRASSYSDAQTMSPGVPLFSPASTSGTGTATMSSFPQNVPPNASTLSPSHLSMDVASTARSSTDTGAYPYSAYGGIAVESNAPGSSIASSSRPSVVPTTVGYPPLAASGSGANEPGPSSAGRFTVANPSRLSGVLDEKSGPIPPPERHESVYQHEDISEVVELPPAYKERTD